VPVWLIDCMATSGIEESDSGTRMGRLGDMAYTEVSIYCPVCFNHLCSFSPSEDTPFESECAGCGWVTWKVTAIGVSNEYGDWGDENEPRSLKQRRRESVSLSDIHRELWNILDSVDGIEYEVLKQRINEAINCRMGGCKWVN